MISALLLQASAILFKVIVALLALSLLIFIHELGHFLVAKWCKVAVLEFAIGFGKVVWQKKYGHTMYSLRAIPLGGYVRMAGDDYNKYYGEEESEEEAQGSEEESSEGDQEKAILQPLSSPEEEAGIPRDQWFFEKSLWARSAIVVAGPVFNFLLAWVLILFVYVFYGASLPSPDPKIGELIPEYPAVEAGLQIGDYVDKVGDTKIITWNQLVEKLKDQKDQPVELSVIRNKGTDEEEILSLTLQPKLESKEMQLIAGEIDENAEPRYLIGIHPSFGKTLIPFQEAIFSSFGHLWFTTELTLKSVWYLVAGDISPKHIGGPITIMNEVGKSAEKGFERLIMIVVFISISLGVLNLLPIPVLDGGHLLLFLLEGLNRGRLPRRFVDYANQVGLVLLLALMIFAIGNDIFRLVS